MNCMDFDLYLIRERSQQMQGRITRFGPGERHAEVVQRLGGGSLR